jgi:hypothetical protein
MTGTTQQNEEIPSSHFGFRDYLNDLGKKEKRETIELIKEYCSKDGSCKTNSCFAQIYFAGKCSNKLATEFFYAFLFEDIKEAKEISVKIATLPRIHIVATMANLGYSFWLLYDHMLEIDPDLETRVRNTYQKWTEKQYEKELWE